MHGNKCFSILGFNAKYRECPSNQCYTSVIDDTIRRGCVGDDFIADADACSNDSNCELCSSSTRCNSHRIDYEKCFSYELSENVPPDVPATLTKVCPLGVRPMGCYHQVLPLEKKIRKGCVIELAEDVRQMCRANGDFCKTCFTDICNFRGVLQTCVTCDSASNPKCLAPDESVPSKHCSDYNDKCYTFTGNNEVKRGCLQEANKEFIASCRDTDKNCKLCFNDELCNKNAIVDTCITCDSENDQRCLNNPESFGETICSVNNLILSQGCYLKKIGEQVKRGCADALPNLDFIGCNENSQYCQKCRRRNCNLRNKFQQECISCDSEQDDRCTMMKHGESFKSILCKNYLSTCLVGINSGGHTYRGCSTDSSINDKIYYSKGFEICSDEKCNEFIFPKDRLLCYQCNGSAECDFNETSNLSIEPVTCKHYTKDDKCYAYVDKGIWIFLQIFIF